VLTPVDTAALLRPLQRLVISFNAHADTVPKGHLDGRRRSRRRDSPFVWTGPGAIGRYNDALLGRTPASPRANDLTTLDEHLEIGSPQSVPVSGEYAMFVVWADATYLDHGTHQRQIARWFITERRVGGEWRTSATVFDVTG
jgi:hypothetical protein